ncbi:MAG TPA: PASTA domain-containing protein, partial [Longimicrobium sp.]|nr:PASTA domain-containing protein [Longimicrobium sp.]
PPPPSGNEGVYVFVTTDSLDGPASPAGAVVLPDLAGLPLREAARRLHERGLRVHVRGSGYVAATYPAAGRSLARGRTVTVLGDSR